MKCSLRIIITIFFAVFLLAGCSLPSEPSLITTAAEQMPTRPNSIATTTDSATTSANITTTVITTTAKKATTTTKQITTTKRAETTHPLSGLPCVQAADPDTGISWDGKSPIVYTYEDGSTGTEAEPGAKYEYRPGVIRCVSPDLSDAPENTGYCPHCGKEEGDGSDGTCLRYIGSSGHNCGHCGVFVAAKTCHTCGN